MKVRKIKEVTIYDMLRQEIKQLKDEARVANAYKKLILTAARSEYEPKDVVSGGTSGDLMARGVCPKCDINLVGKEPRPRDFTLPCLIKGCTFNKKNNTKAIQ